ncbi:hypothetical protein BY996DRAFT_6412316 [Phakopsora pachyrhizi]|nr:hypothetical protein BY996DRAFT_6412316 [Phakopsora pachyrhizi]
MAGRGLAQQGWVLGLVGKVGLAGAWLGWVLGLVGKLGLAGLSSAGLGWVLRQVGAWLGWLGLVQGLVGWAGRGLAGLGPGAGDKIRTKLRPVLKPERQAEGFWVEASGVENLQ